jgi:hypothetical protein
VARTVSIGLVPGNPSQLAFEEPAADSRAWRSFAAGFFINDPYGTLIYDFEFRYQFRPHKVDKARRDAGIEWLRWCHYNTSISNNIIPPQHLTFRYIIPPPKPNVYPLGGGAKNNREMDSKSPGSQSLCDLT